MEKSSQRLSVGPRGRGTSPCGSAVHIPPLPRQPQHPPPRSTKLALFSGPGTAGSITHCAPPAGSQKESAESLGASGKEPASPAAPVPACSQNQEK